MAGVYRWFLVRREELRGHWRIKPSYALPPGTHLRYWAPESDPSVALVRVWNADSAALTQIAEDAALTDDVVRIPLSRLWGEVKDHPIAQYLRQQWPIMDSIPDSWTVDRVVDEIISRLEGTTKRRRQKLSFMGEDPPEE